MKYIENDSLKVMFNNEGTITSIFDKVNDSELVHQLDEEGWKFQDVTIFPLIGSYDYEVDGVNYHISSRHGFVRNREFTCVKNSEEEITFSYSSDDEDLAIYPFKFRLEVTYLLKGRELTTSYLVNNLDSKRMYYSLGNHLAIRAREGDRILTFDSRIYMKLNNGVIEVDNKNVKDDLVISKDLFKELDTIVMINESDKVVVLTKTHKVTYRFNSPLFALWTNKDTSNFICVEPWYGIGSYLNEPKELKERLYINELEPSSIRKHTHSINFELIDDFN